VRNPLFFVVALLVCLALAAVSACADGTSVFLKYPTLRQLTDETSHGGAGFLSTSRKAGMRFQTADVLCPVSRAYYASAAR
jgi:hypothetical protein